MAEDVEQGPSESKVRVDQLLQQVVQQSKKDAVEAKKKKKKKAKADQDDMLELLRKGEGTGLHKDKDDTIEANTFDPDNHPKSEKSNKRRQKLKEEEQNEKERVKKGKKKLPKVEDTVEMIDETVEKKPGKKKKKKEETPAEEPVKDETPPTDVTPKKKKKKKVEIPEEPVTVEPSATDVTPKKKKRTKKVVEEETTFNEEAVPGPSEQPEETTSLVSPRDGKKKKKKKKRQEGEEVADEAQATTEEATVDTAEEGATAEETSPRADSPKKKKKKKKPEKTEEELAAEAEEAVSRLRSVDDAGKILAVTVHRTDKLKNDFHILHPMVRVHMVDETTGTYVKKQKDSRAVTAYYENRPNPEKTTNNVDHILPIMTQPFDFKQKKSTLPVWEEILIFNENFDYIIQNDLKVILFFELLDFVSMNAASRKYNNEKQEGGWHRIGWAFLKVHGGNQKLNVGSKVRLQLFQPPTRFSVKPGKVEIYQWWYSLPRVAYPSTLYVTLKGIVPPDEVEPAGRSFFATQEEKGRMTYEDLKKSMNWHSKTAVEERRPMASWSRLFGQLCRIPNNLKMSLPAGRKGCYVIKFSHDGRSLACACQDKDGYPIKVYDIPAGTLRGEFSGHFGIIYDLSWSKKDTHLLSASSDGTARVWDLQNFSSSSEKLLPHPAFVYTAQYHPRVSELVVTGGYDQVLRIWDIKGEEPHGQLMQEIENHHGHINCVCFDEDGEKLYSADSTGTILIWNVHATQQDGRRAFIREWTLYHEIKDPDIKNVAINCIRMHPSGRRLLVHCRDNIVRMLDLRVQRIMQKYIGALNFREKIRSAISPCGTFVFSGSEDNTAYVWNTDTGDQVARYSDLNYQSPVTDVDYHPRDHMIAVCSLGDNQPVLLYNYDPQVAHLGMGLPVREAEESTDVEELPSARLTGRKSPLQTEEALASARSQVFSKSEFEASEKMRYQRIMRKLDSATMQMAQGPLFQTAEPHPFSASTSSMTAGWANTFDQGYGLTPRASSVHPSTFSPHAPQTMSSRMQHQQYSNQNLYLKQSDGWRPTFSDVGQKPSSRPSSPTFYGRPHQLSLSASQGKANFTFHSAPGKGGMQHRVVAMYDYRAQRSDELTIYKGDTIVVLYKDNENWWMGELADGSQGFFPANYVISEDAYGDEELEEVVRDDKKKKKRKEVTALKTKDGDLKFFSATDDSDAEGTPKKSQSRLSSTGESDSDSRPKKTKRRVRLNESTA